MSTQRAVIAREKKEEHRTEREITRCHRILYISPRLKPFLPAQQRKAIVYSQGDPTCSLSPLTLSFYFATPLWFFIILSMWELDTEIDARRTVVVSSSSSSTCTLLQKPRFCISSLNVYFVLCSLVFFLLGRRI